MRPLEEMPLDDDEKDAKFSKPKKGRSKRKAKGTANALPSAIVCTPSEAASQGAIEIGAVLSILVLFLYFFACYETVMSLPDAPVMPDFGAHMGENFNLAINGFDSAGDGSEGGREMASSKREGSAGGDSRGIDDNEVAIPTSKWPVTLRDEPDNYETILHPGDLKTKMSVPKFWSKPIHNGKLMTRETAMKIGTCISPDNGNYQRGDACPHHKRTVFISIASYRDFECRTTVESAFGRAKYPDRVRIAVVDQIVAGEDNLCNEPIEPCDQKPEQALCKYKNQVDVYQMEASLSVGPVFARHIGYRMYRGEYYATQSDAHVTFTEGWDVDIITQIEATHNEMAVLSTYLTDVQGSIDKDGHSLRKTRPIMCNTVWEGGAQGYHLRHASQPEKFPSIHGEPQLSPWWAAGYSFSRGHFIVNVPYDLYQPMIFQGEEMSIGIRGFTVGYDFYAPERSVCFHHYAVGKNAAVRNKVHHFWENDQKYSGTGRKAMQRLLGIVKMNPEVDVANWDHTDEDIYGLGGVRTTEKFYETFGIDVVEKKIDNLCPFVDGQQTGGLMHKMFTPHIRKDGMGIDYSKISFKYDKVTWSQAQPGRT